MGEYLDALWSDLEQTWDLAMKVNDLPEQQRGDVEAAWQEFKGSKLVDLQKTEQEAETPPKKIFCTNIYGIEFNPETKYWVPFRHGEIDLAKFTED